MQFYGCCLTGNNAEYTIDQRHRVHLVCLALLTAPAHITSKSGKLKSQIRQLGIFKLFYLSTRHSDAWATDPVPA